MLLLRNKGTRQWYKNVFCELSCLLKSTTLFSVDGNIIITLFTVVAKETIYNVSTNIASPCTNLKNDLIWFGYQMERICFYSIFLGLF